MPVLDNARHEKFARLIVDGASGRAAYRGAGFKPKNDATADACASRLLADAKVAARVAELKKAIAEQLVCDQVMSLEQVLAELSKLGRANMQDFVGAEGDTTADVIASLRELPREHAAAIQELSVETYLEGHGDDAREVKRVKLKLHDKRGALAELRRHYEPQKHEHAGKNGGPIETRDVGALSDLDLARRIAFALERAARATKPKGKRGGKLHRQGGQASGPDEARR